MVEFEGHTGVLTALTDVTERKQAEHLLTRYQLLAENLRDILIFFREDGSIFEANRAACEAYGYNADELSKLRVEDLRAPETLTEIPRQFAQALDQGIRFETRHRRSDGETFPVEVVSQSADLAGERIVLSLIRDVTERAKAESALRASEERLRLALDAARMSTWEFDFASGSRTAGGNHELLMGSNPDSIEGLFELIHPADRDRIRQAIATAESHGGEYAQEFRLLHPTGETRWIAAHGRALGQPLRLVGVAYDISDRKRAESLLRASEARFRALAETMPQLVWSCNPDGACDYLSRQWGEYTGVPIEPQLGYGWVEEIHPDDRDHLLTAWNVAVASGDLYDVECRIRRHDGVYRWFKSRAVAVRDESGAIAKWYGSNTDIDDLKQVEERRRALIDTLAHDLKNPLAAIKAQSQVLRRRLLRGHAIDEDNLAMLAETASNMADLIDEMSDASKLAAGQDLELEPASFDLVTLLERTAIAYGGTSSRHNVSVEARIDRLIGTWDRARLERVFGNLLANAIKYSPAGGDVTVTVDHVRDERGDWAVAAVSDQGIGIPESDLSLVFERHRRGRNVGQIRGNGLGLAGAADVIRLHGGEIGVASEEGAGSTFTVWLPVRTSDAPGA
jgi:PAS domain S-box-containing protein